MKGMKPSLRTAVALTFLAAGGCGLISSDVFRVTFDLPTQTYTFDTAQWGNLPPGQVPAIPCTMDPDNCCTLATAAGLNCTTTPLVCKSGACAAEIPESTSTTINLAMQVGSLSQYASLGNISISSISYKVSNNTLNVDLPALSIYLAPATPVNVTDPTDPQAQLFGTTQPIPAGTDPSMMVQLVPNAAAIFQMFTSKLSTAFNFIAATTVEIAAGTPVPMGQVTISITGTISAQP